MYRMWIVINGEKTQKKSIRNENASFKQSVVKQGLSKRDNIQINT